MRKAVAALTIVVMLVLSANVMAQEKTTSVGIGGHLGWPTLIGPSVKVWLSPRIGVQGMGSFFSVGDFSLTMLSGRVLLKLSQTEGKIFPYLGVGAGAWIASGEDTEWDPDLYGPGWGGYTEKDVTETVGTFEALLGFQHKYNKNFCGDYELGYYMVNFDEADITVSGMALSLAFHYFF